MYIYLFSRTRLGLIQIKSNIYPTYVIYIILPAIISLTQAVTNWDLIFTFVKFISGNPDLEFQAKLTVCIFFAPHLQFKES